MKPTAEQELLLREWAEYTTGANTHNMNRRLCNYRFYAGLVADPVLAERYSDSERANLLEKEMYSILAELKLARINGTFFKVT